MGDGFRKVSEQIGWIFPRSPEDIRKTPEGGTEYSVSISPDTLLVPMQQFSQQQTVITGIQQIFTDGSKQHMKGSKVAWHICGDLDTAKVIYITEGVATARTIRNLIPGSASIAGMSSGTLYKTVKAYPQYQSKMVVASDNDDAGRKAAAKIAQDFGIQSAIPGYVSDWNDAYCDCMDGKEFQRKLLESQV